MKFFKSNKFKWTVFGGVTAIILAGTFVTITIKNYQKISESRDFTRTGDDEVDPNEEQKVDINEIEPKIKETIIRDLGIAPIEYKYHLNKDSTSLESVELIFSPAVKDENNFPNAVFFTELNENIVINDNVTLKLDLDYDPYFKNISEVLEREINQIITKMYFTLLNKGSFALGGVEVLRGKSVSKHDFYYGLTPKQNKIFLKNYRDLSKFSGSDLTNELFRLNLINPFLEEFLDK